MTFGSLDSIAQGDSSIFQEEHSTEIQNLENNENIPRTVNLLDTLEAGLEISTPQDGNSNSNINIGGLNNTNFDDYFSEQTPKKLLDQKVYQYGSQKEETSTPRLGGRNNEHFGVKVNQIDGLKSIDSSNPSKSTPMDKDVENKQEMQRKEINLADIPQLITEAVPAKKGLRGPANYKEGEGQSFVPKHRVNIRESRDDNHVEKVEKKKSRNRGKSEADRLTDFYRPADHDFLKQSDQSLHEAEKARHRVAPYTLTPPKSRARTKREDSDEDFIEQQPSSSKGDYGQESKRAKSGAAAQQVIYGYRAPQDYMYQNSNYMPTQPQYLQDFMIQPTRQWMPMQQLIGTQPLLQGQPIMNAPYGYAYYNPVDYDQKPVKEIETALPPFAPGPPKQGKANKAKKPIEFEEGSSLEERSPKLGERAEEYPDRVSQKIVIPQQSGAQLESFPTSPPQSNQLNSPPTPQGAPIQNLSNPTQTINVQPPIVASPTISQLPTSNMPDSKSQLNYNQPGLNAGAMGSSTATGSQVSQQVSPVQPSLPPSYPSPPIAGQTTAQQTQAQPVPIQLPQLQQITVQQTNPILPAQQQSNTPQFTQQIAQAVPAIPPQIFQAYPIPSHTAESSGITASETEQSRLSALYALGILDASDNPRLNKITQMTAKLLGRTCCVLSLVDTDKVIWKSASYTSPIASPIKEEARYESFCSWVVQDESGRGITILDAKSDPRCRHMRVKPGLEFYAGVPIVISVIDMNILHEMAEWASCELDTIAQQNLLQSKEQKLDSLNKLTDIKNMNIKSEREMECLAIIKNALKASSVLLLKLAPDSKGFDCVLQAYCNAGSVNATNLPIGEQMFHELAVLTLKKDPISQPLVLELKVGAVTKDVDHYLTKKINRVASDVVWTQGGPSGILAVFFEGAFRAVGQEDLKFIEKAMPIFSNIAESLEVRDSLIQASGVHKIMGAALKKYALPFGSHHGLAPVVLVIQPVFSAIKGYELNGNALYQKSERENQLASDLYNNSSTNIAPKGQAHAQLLAKQLEVESLMGASSKQNIEPAHITNRKPVIDILPMECFDVLNDFSQILDVLADKFTLKKPKRIANQYYLLANYGLDTGTPNDVATFAHELFFSLDVYNQNKRRNIKAQVGIHCDFTPVELAQDSAALKDQFQSMINAAYKLQVSSDTILVSDIFYHQTKQICSYEAGPAIVLKGQGLFSTYKLIGKCTEVVEAVETTIKENGINDKGSLILSTMPQQQPPVAEPPEGAVITGKIFPEITSAFAPSDAKKEKKRCTIL
ncbi:hypothetical protein HDV01_003025 [Terramyces sp. JEL0728]|nr:hypothetical protein HDV01_003025 [Terramyces sp. JEL0728]